MPQKKRSSRQSGSARSARFGRRVPQDPEILDSQQAAVALGVSERLVLRLAREARIPGQKVGRSWRFSRSALRNYLAGESPDVLERVLRKRGLKISRK